MTRTFRGRSALMAVALAIAPTACGGGDSAETGGQERRASGLSTTTTDPTTAAPSSAPPAGVQVFGKVTAGPTCPVAQAELPCDPRPVDAEVEARTSVGEVAGSTHTDATGAFSLAPASYTLTAVTRAALPRCQAVPVTVASGPPMQANIDCDTGIR
ncbi:MAG TPA: hypothetical protein VGJ86_25420 [Acidimicrobiales bacterium]|jgi:hypothetical protein